MNDKPIAAGKSSFSLIDPEALFAALPLAGKTRILDAACGNGAYAVGLSKRVEPNACIYALDLWEEGIQELKIAMDAQGINNIQPILADISKTTTLSDAFIDLCLMASVLHDLIEDGVAEAAIKEITRVVKPGAELAVIEFKKMAEPPGPPENIRITPEDLEKRLAPFGFTGLETREVGPYHYLFRFTLGPGQNT